MEDSQNMQHTSESSAPMAALAYVPVLFVITLLQKGKDEFHLWHAKVGAAMTIIVVLITLLPRLIYIGWIGYFLYLTWLVAAIVAGYRANKGEKWVIPGISQIAQVLPLGKTNAATDTATAPVTQEASAEMPEPAMQANAAEPVTPMPEPMPAPEPMPEPAPMNTAQPMPIPEPEATPPQVETQAPPPEPAPMPTPTPEEEVEEDSPEAAAAAAGIDIKPAGPVAGQTEAEAIAEEAATQEKIGGQTEETSPVTPNQTL